VPLVRDLLAAVHREEAAIGVLITMYEPTSAMRSEAASAGYYEAPWTGARYPRLQLLTVEDLLTGRTVAYPALRDGDRTFQRVPRASESQTREAPLFDGEEDS
jgi:hypothetical protein